MQHEIELYLQFLQGHDQLKQGSDFHSQQVRTHLFAISRARPPSMCRVHQDSTIKFFSGRSLVSNCLYASRFDSICHRYQIASRPLRRNSMLQTSLVTKIAFI
jgi:hypothetical protein